MDRYDEALAKARAGKSLEEIFPEMNESEDERMRKAALEGIEYLERDCGWDVIGDIDILDVKEYLVKQKEQKPKEIDERKIINKHITEDSLSSDVNSRLKECGWYVTDEKSAEWSEEEKDKLNSIERLIVNANAHGNYLIGDKEATDLQHFIRSIVKPTTNLIIHQQDGFF